MIKSKNHLYWILTISCWLIFGIYKSLLSPFWSVESSEKWLIELFTFINPLTMLLLTHLYRQIAHRFSLNNLSFQKTILVIGVASLALIGIFLIIKFQINPLLIEIITKVFHIYLPENYNSIPESLQNTMNFVFPYMFTLEYSAFVIWLAFYHAYHYFENIQLKTVESYEAKMQLQQSELSFLRSQLNPHFLFNALNSINALAMMKSDKASDAVLLLSDLMRYTLNYGKKNLVPLKEEIDIVDKYLQFEKIRFGNKLNCTFEVEDSTLEVKIPPIIIQTLSENAIKHAIKQSVNGGFIKIKSYLKNDFLNIEVINNGQLTASTTTPSVLEEKEGGIGIENTQKRLKMLYDDKAFFELRNANENEVVAHIRIPIV